MAFGFCSASSSASVFFTPQESPFQPRRRSPAISEESVMAETGESECVLLQQINLGRDDFSVDRGSLSLSLCPASAV